MQPTLPFRRDDQPETDLLEPNFAEGAEGGHELAEARELAEPREVADRRELAGGLNEADFAAEARRRKRERFEEVAERLDAALEARPELRRFQEQLLVEDTAEGVRIQLVDREQASMFPVGSDAMYPHTRRLLEAVVAAVGALPNRLSVRGHTDALPYARGAAYDNWRLSSARADATRRMLGELGLASRRVAEVVGKGDGEPLVAEAPADPRNRRISIVLLDEVRPR